MSQLTAIVKKAIMTVTIPAAIIVGEYTQPLHQAQKAFRDHYISREDGFYQGAVEIVTTINENKREEIYLQDKDGERYKVKMINGKPVVNGELDNPIYEIKNEWQEFKDDVKENYQKAEDKVKQWNEDAMEWVREQFGKETASADTTKPWIKEQYQKFNERINKEE